MNTVTILPYLLAVIVATLITAHFELFNPAMREVEILDPDNLVIQSKYLTYFVLYSVAAVFLPLTLIISLYPPFAEKFKTSLIKSLLGT